MGNARKACSLFVPCDNELHCIIYILSLKTRPQKYQLFANQHIYEMNRHFLLSDLCKLNVNM